MPQDSHQAGTERRSGSVRLAELIVVAYAIGAVLYSFTSDASRNPPWLLGLSVIAGVASVLANRRFTESGASPDARWLLVPFLILLTGRQLFLLFLGSTFMAYGAFGLARGRIDLEGRSGPRRTYSGRAGHVSSIMCILSGGAAVAWALLRE